VAGGKTNQGCRHPVGITHVFAVGVGGMALGTCFVVFVRGRMGKFEKLPTKFERLES
jgi:hypothetical protein